MNPPGFLGGSGGFGPLDPKDARTGLRTRRRTTPTPLRRETSEDKVTQVVSDSPTVYEALRGAIAAVGGVDKDGFNEHQSFAFRSIEGTVAATRQALLDHQISLIPSFSLIKSSDWDRGEGKSPSHRTELAGTFRVVGPSGDEFSFDTIGEAVDTEGRSANKAMSAATKNALLRLLQIGSGEDGDAQDQHQPTYQAPPAQPRQASQTSTSTVAPTSVESRVAQAAARTQPAQQQQGGGGLLSKGQSGNLYRLFKKLESDQEWDRDRYKQEIELVTGDTGGDDRKLSPAQASDLIKSLKQHAGEEDEQRQAPPPQTSYGHSTEEF